MRHHKKHRRTKWTKELAWHEEVKLSMSCLSKEIAYLKEHGETYGTSTYKCTCPPAPSFKEVWK